MDIQKVFSKFCSEWFKLRFTQRSLSDDKLEFDASLTAEEYYDDTLFFEGVLYKSGTIHVFVTFDEINRTFENYEAINELNRNTSFLKAYIDTIDGKNFLQIHYNFIAESDNAAVENLGLVLDDLLSEDVAKQLRPLADITK